MGNSWQFLRPYGSKRQSRARVEEKEFSNSLIRVKRKKSDIRFVSGKEKEMMMMMRKDNKTTNKSI